MTTQLKGIFCTFIGTAVGVASAIFGKWTGDMTTLLVFMTVDFIMGLCVAAVFKKSEKSEGGALSSRAGWKGLCRKGVTWLIVLVAHRLDNALGTSFIRTATVVGFTANEALSILENAGLMGIKLPSQLKTAIDVLVRKGEGKNDKND